MTTTTPAKPATEVPATVTTNRGKEIETTAALARPRRNAVAPVPNGVSASDVKKGQRLNSVHTKFIRLTCIQYR